MAGQRLGRALQNCPSRPVETFWDEWDSLEPGEAWPGRTALPGPGSPGMATPVSVPPWLTCVGHDGAQQGHGGHPVHGRAGCSGGGGGSDGRGRRSPAAPRGAQWCAGPSGGVHPGGSEDVQVAELPGPGQPGQGAGHLHAQPLGHSFSSMLGREASARRSSCRDTAGLAEAPSKVTLCARRGRKSSVSSRWGLKPPAQGLISADIGSARQQTPDWAAPAASRAKLV